MNIGNREHVLAAMILATRPKFPPEAKIKVRTNGSRPWVLQCHIGIERDESSYYVVDWVLDLAEETILNGEAGAIARLMEDRVNFAVADLEELRRCSSEKVRPA